MEYEAWYVTKIGEESRSGQVDILKEGSSIVRVGKYSPPTFISCFAKIPFLSEPVSPITFFQVPDAVTHNLFVGT